MQWIICVSWDGSACPTLFPGCFQSHQLHFRKDPGAHYFAGTGCFCLPMSGFRDWSHLKLGLDLGLCMCNLWMYPHNVYTFILLMYITRRVYVICMYLFQDKIKKKKKTALSCCSYSFSCKKLKILVFLIDSSYGQFGK